MSRFYATFDSLGGTSGAQLGWYEVSMWVMELLILLGIAYEIYVTVDTRRQERRRQTCIMRRVAALRELLSSGQTLQNSSPKLLEPNPGKWIESFEAWTKAAQALLGSYSPQAEVTFLLDPKDRGLDLVGGAQAQQALLRARLNNLRGIIEKPEVYF
jgi:hypothetical protein